MNEVPFRDLVLPLDHYGSGGTGVLLAHGAGTHRGHRGVVGIAQGLAKRGLAVATFDYPHVVQGRRSPGRPTVALEAHRLVAETVAPEFETFIMAGRSFGGRLSTMLSADGVASDAVVAFGYPLHPPGKLDRLRIEHLGDLGAPTLFIQGTKDHLARAELVTEYLEPVGTVSWLEGGSHSMRVKGSEEAETLDLVVDRAVSWLSEMGITRLGSEATDKA